MDLPEEILIHHIFSYLSISDILTFTSTCKLFYDHDFWTMIGKRDYHWTITTREEYERLYKIEKSITCKKVEYERWERIGFVEREGQMIWKTMDYPMKMLNDNFLEHFQQWYPDYVLLNSGWRNREEDVDGILPPIFEWICDDGAYEEELGMKMIDFENVYEFWHGQGSFARDLKQMHPNPVNMKMYRTSLYQRIFEQ